MGGAGKSILHNKSIIIIIYLVMIFGAVFSPSFPSSILFVTHNGGLALPCIIIIFRTVVGASFPLRCYDEAPILTNDGPPQLHCTLRSHPLDCSSTKPNRVIMERGVYTSLGVLFVIGVVDAVSYMAVGPSLIFYVTEVGGSKEEYGLIMSAFSFASFCFKPIYGYWVDATGNKYRSSYMVSFCLAIFGNMVYWLAITLPHGNPAVYCLLVGRLFAGMGAANNTLGYSFVATAVPHDKQTTINIVLSLARIFGMTMAPFINLLFRGIDTELHVGQLVIPMNPYNSVGLFVAGGNLLVLLTTLIVMKEPPEQKKASLSDRGEKPGMKEVWKAVVSLKVMLPLLIILVVNSNYQT
jgi:Major Facilitator Superfamily